MDIGTLDYWANQRQSWLHRASAPVKLIWLGLVLMAVVSNGSLTVLLLVYASLLLMIVSTRLPLVQILGVASYPVVFVLLLVVASWDGTWLSPLLLLGKALTAALAAVTVVVTTPYPRIFATLRPVLPGPVVDALFLTYRSLFLLLELMGRLLRALRLRGGLSRVPYRQRLMNLAGALGLLLMRSLDLSQGLYAAMHLRGYQGYIPSSLRRSSSLHINGLLVAHGVALMVASVVVSSL